MVLSRKAKEEEEELDAQERLRHHAAVSYMYGVATISRMLKNICLFAEHRSLL